MDLIVERASAKLGHILPGSVFLELQTNLKASELKCPRQLAFSKNV